MRETNLFFDRPDGSLRQRGTGLRVRLSVSGDAATPVALLTVKGPAGAAGLRSREAFDLTLTPHDQIIPLLLALGFEQMLLFEKDRESWTLDGCLVELDTLPVFGTFVEVEGPSEARVLAVREKLGLVHLPPEFTSYSKMVGTLLAREAGGRRELRFGAG